MLGRIEGQSKLRVLENTNSEITVKDWLFSRTDCGKQEPMINRTRKVCRDLKPLDWPQGRLPHSHDHELARPGGGPFLFYFAGLTQQVPRMKKERSSRKGSEERKEGCWSANSCKRKAVNLSLLGLWFCILIFFPTNHFPISLHPPFVFTITSLNILLSERANCKLSWH